MKQKFKSLNAFKKIIILFILISLIFAICYIGINGFVVLKAKQYVLTPTSTEQISDADCILVLGCAVYGEGTLSPMLEDRVITAIDLYNKGVSKKLLMSGDHGKENYDEVNSMKQYCVNNGLNPDIIFLDHAGFSTYESMYRAKSIFGVKKMIIVTQKYHLYRAVYIARSLGIEAYGVASENIAFDKATNRYNSARESLARIKDFFTCIVKPSPTYLGEEVPINGNAQLSDDKEYV